MGDRVLNISELQRQLDDFAEERDWNQFHSPKNLSMALAGEAGELLEVFQWLTEDESRVAKDDPNAVRRIATELADVMIYVIRIADAVGIDLDVAIRSKLETNAARYPADRVRGSAAKYTEYSNGPGDHPAGGK